MQNDLRSLLTYIKEAHEQVFRRIVMAGVMESQQRQAVIRSRPETPTPMHQSMSMTLVNRKPLVRHPRIDSGEDNLTGVETDQENFSSLEVEATPSAKKLRNIFAKRPKISLKPLGSRESSETNLTVKMGNSMRSPRVSISEDESVAMLTLMSPHGKKKKTGAGGNTGARLRERWLKSPKSSEGSREGVWARPDGGELPRSISLVSGEGGLASLAGDASRQQSMESSMPLPSAANLKPRLSFKATGHINLGVLKGRRMHESSSQEDDSPRG